MDIDILGVKSVGETEWVKAKISPNEHTIWVSLGGEQPIIYFTVSYYMLQASHLTITFNRGQRDQVC